MTPRCAEPPLFDHLVGAAGRATKDPVDLAIAQHRKAFARARQPEGFSVEGSAAIDDVSERFLEVTTTSTAGCIRLALYVHQFAIEHGEGVFPAPQCCRDPAQYAAKENSWLHDSRR